MEVFIKWKNLEEILETKNSLQYWWYKWDIKVLLTKDLEKDIIEKIWPWTISIKENEVRQVFWLDIIHYFK